MRERIKVSEGQLLSEVIPLRNIRVRNHRKYVEDIKIRRDLRYDIEVDARIR